MLAQPLAASGCSSSWPPPPPLSTQQQHRCRRRLPCRRRLLHQSSSQRSCPGRQQMQVLPRVQERKQQPWPGEQQRTRHPCRLFLPCPSSSLSRRKLVGARRGAQPQPHLRQQRQRPSSSTLPPRSRTRRERCSTALAAAAAPSRTPMALLISPHRPPACSMLGGMGSACAAAQQAAAARARERCRRAWLTRQRHDWCWSRCCRCVPRQALHRCAGGPGTGACDVTAQGLL